MFIWEDEQRLFVIFGISSDVGKLVRKDSFYWGKGNYCTEFSSPVFIGDS